MKLLELKLWGYKNLEDITIDFEKSDGCTLIVGTNGSGKSNLLEALSAIFSALYSRNKNVSPDFRFELKYALNESYIVFVRNADGVIDLSYCESVDDTDYKLVDAKDFDSYLPDHVIAVYSGEEQRLWENYYFSAYSTYNKQYMDGKTAFHPQRMIYLNHYYWDLIASILSIHEIEDYRRFISDNIGIKDISSIHMEFDVDNLRNNRNERAKHILEILNPEKKTSVDVSLDTLFSVKEYCGYESDMFYNMVVLRLYKDYKIITDIIIKCGNGIEIKDLSEGEKKLLLIYGAINLLSGNNLYLLDEPDAHLHEGRKKEIFDLIRQDDHSQFVITSHSPALTYIFPLSQQCFLVNTENGIKQLNEEKKQAISRLTDGMWITDAQNIAFHQNKPIVVFEGKTDVSYVKRAIELLQKDTPKYNIQASFFSAGGADNIVFFIKDLHSLVDKNEKIIVFFDRDNQGKQGASALAGLSEDSEQIVHYEDIILDNLTISFIPYKDAGTTGDFLIEDYFSWDLTVKPMVDKAIEKHKHPLKNLPSLAKQIKKQIQEDYMGFSEEEFKGFGVLLDKILNLIEA